MTAPTEKNSPIILLEKAIASRLSLIPAVRVDRFADSFKSQGKVTQRQQLRIGHSGSTYQVIDDGMRSGTTIEKETAQFEIGCEVANLGNHEQALGLIAEAMRSLSAFHPYTGIDPIVRVRYGDARFDPGRGIWEYVGVVQASLIWKNGNEPIIQLVSDLPNEAIPIIRVWRGQEGEGKTLVKEITI